MSIIKDIFNTESLLINDLEKALIELENREGDLIEEVRKSIKLNLKKLKAGDKKSLDEIWTIFAPTSYWDDIKGNENLANRIFNSVDILRNEK